MRIQHRFLGRPAGLNLDADEPITFQITRVRGSIDLTATAEGVALTRLRQRLGSGTVERDRLLFCGRMINGIFSIHSVRIPTRAEIAAADPASGEVPDLDPPEASDEAPAASETVSVSDSDAAPVPEASVTAAPVETWSAFAANLAPQEATVVEETAPVQEEAVPASVAQDPVPAAEAVAPVARPEPNVLTYYGFVRELRIFTSSYGPFARFTISRGPSKSPAFAKMSGKVLSLYQELSERVPDTQRLAIQGVFQTETYTRNGVTRQNYVFLVRSIDLIEEQPGTGHIQSDGTRVAVGDVSVKPMQDGRFKVVAVSRANRGVTFEHTGPDQDGMPEATAWKLCTKVRGLREINPSLWKTFS